MKNKLKFNFFLILIISILNGCQNATEGFLGSKKNNSDEFLVQKKIRWCCHRIMKNYQLHKVQ